LDNPSELYNSASPLWERSTIQSFRNRHLEIDPLEIDPLEIDPLGIGVQGEFS
jgi:hypothetical protein